jgi:hypothetical protein
LESTTHEPMLFIPKAKIFFATLGERGGKAPYFALQH